MLLTLNAVLRFGNVELWICCMDHGAEHRGKGGRKMVALIEVYFTLSPNSAFLPFFF